MLQVHSTQYFNQILCPETTSSYILVAPAKINKNEHNKLCSFLLSFRNCFSPLHLFILSSLSIHLPLLFLCSVAWMPLQVTSRFFLLPGVRRNRNVYMLLPLRRPGIQATMYNVSRWTKGSVLQIFHICTSITLQSSMWGYIDTISSLNGKNISFEIRLYVTIRKNKILINKNIK